MKQLTSQVPVADMAAYFERLMPSHLPEPNPSDEEDNAVLQRHVYLLGDQGAGKTNATKLFVNEAAVRYGGLGLFVLRGKAEQLEAMLAADWPRRLCVMLIVEDTTGVNLPDSVVINYFRLRELMMQKTGLRRGIVLLLFCSHRLHANLISLRATYTSLIVLSSPMNDYDHNFIERKVGGEALRCLETAEDRLEKGWTLVTYRRSFLGVTRIPQLTFNTPIRNQEAETQTRTPTFHLPLHFPTHTKPKQSDMKPQRFCHRCGQPTTGKCVTCG